MLPSPVQVGSDSGPPSNDEKFLEVVDTILVIYLCRSPMTTTRTTRVATNLKRFSLHFHRRAKQTPWRKWFKPTLNMPRPGSSLWRKLRCCCFCWRLKVATPLVLLLYRADDNDDERIMTGMMNKRLVLDENGRGWENVGCFTTCVSECVYVCVYVDSVFGWVTSLSVLIFRPLLLRLMCVCVCVSGKCAKRKRCTGNSVVLVGWLRTRERVLRWAPQ